MVFPNNLSISLHNIAYGMHPVFSHIISNHCVESSSGTHSHTPYAKSHFTIVAVYQLVYIGAVKILQNAISELAFLRFHVGNTFDELQSLIFECCVLRIFIRIVKLQILQRVWLFIWLWNIPIDSAFRGVFHWLRQQ